MLRRFLLCIPLLLAAGAVLGDDAPEAGDKLLEGMTIVGNDDAPKSLAIVPWKGPNLGDALDVARSLCDGPRPVDRDVFLRELDYYQIRAGSGGAGGSTP